MRSPDPRPRRTRPPIRIRRCIYGLWKCGQPRVEAAIRNRLFSTTTRLSLTPESLRMSPRTVVEGDRSSIVDALLVQLFIGGSPSPSLLALIIRSDRTLRGRLQISRRL
jgi:hypothetical protein